jgi:hypothetical protein
MSLAHRAPSETLRSIGDLMSYPRYLRSWQRRPGRTESTYGKWSVLRFLGSLPSYSLFGDSERNHKETWAGCIVSPTTLTRSSLSASRSVSSLSLAEKASRVFAASYLLR